MHRFLYKEPSMPFQQPYYKPHLKKKIPGLERLSKLPKVKMLRSVKASPGTQTDLTKKKKKV